MTRLYRAPCPRTQIARCSSSAAISERLHCEVDARCAHESAHARRERDRPARAVELDALPFGVVCVDQAMKVVRLNRAAADRAGLARWRVIGRDFRDAVAPRVTDRQFADHVRAFVAGQEPTDSVTHTFHRRSGDDDAVIDLRRERNRVYLCIASSAGRRS
jgi:PAS domain-containing protein